MDPGILSQTVGSLSEVLRSCPLPPGLLTHLTNIPESDIIDADNPIKRSVLELHILQATYPQFRVLYSRRLPFIVNVPNQLQYPWSPDHFRGRYGSQMCRVQDCASGIETREPLSSFLTKMESLDCPEILRVKVNSSHLFI
jgi:hypothetical protein